MLCDGCVFDPTQPATLSGVVNLGTGAAYTDATAFDIRLEVRGRNFAPTNLAAALGGPSALRCALWPEPAQAAQAAREAAGCREVAGCLDTSPGSYPEVPDVGSEARQAHSSS